MNLRAVLSKTPHGLFLSLFAVGLCLAPWSAGAQSLQSTPTAFEDAQDVQRAERSLVDRWMTCDGPARNDEELDALQRTLDAQSARELEELEAAFVHARRAARLPEVIRFQAGGRYDRDQQNRKRLTENYDDFGDLERSALENRDTFRDDMYVNVNLTAEWRLTQTRWSRDEMALRREKTALKKAQQKRAQDATQHWFALHNARLSWCELQSPKDPYAPAQEPSDAQQERARLKIWEELSILNTLTYGWFLFHIEENAPHSSPAPMETSPPENAPTPTDAAPTPTDAAPTSTTPSTSSDDGEQGHATPERLEVRHPREPSSSRNAADTSTAQRSADTPRIEAIPIAR